MKKIFCLIIIIFISKTLLSQEIKILFKDKHTKDAIPFVTIQLKERKWIGTVSNLNGEIVLKKENYSTYKGKTIIINCLGFHTIEKKLSENEKKLTIYLNQKMHSLSEIKVKAGINPAKELIKKVIKHRKTNNPDYLKFYNCDVYNKSVFDVRPIKKHLSKEDYKSILEENKKMAIMISESQKRLSYTYKNNFKEEVIASKISGFKKFDLFAIKPNLQPAHFYKPTITLYTVNYINPISHDGKNSYIFIMKDTLVDKKDSTYIVDFIPRNKKSKLHLIGQLHISSKSYAIKTVIAESNYNTLMSMKIKQSYKYLNNKYMPWEQFFELRFKEYPVKSSPLTWVENTFYSNYDFTHNKKVKGTSLNLRNDAHLKTDKDWEKIRKQKLSKRETKTYNELDSIVRGTFMEDFGNFMDKLLQGKIPLKIFDIDITELRNNDYEGNRLGLGIETNEKVSNAFRVGGHYAYGTKDKNHKYGGFIKLFTDKYNDSFIKFSYKNDVFEEGQSNLPNSNNYLRNNLANKYFKTKRYKAEYNLIIPGFEMNIGALKDNYSYLYNNTLTIEDKTTEGFINLKFIPNQKLIRGYSMIKDEIINKPIFNISYFQNLDHSLNSNNSYYRLEGGFEYNSVINGLGISHIKLEAGLLEGNAPLIKKYYGKGVARDNWNLYLKDYFQTMNPYEYINDRYINLFFTHEFMRPIYSYEYSEPRIQLVHASNYGYLAKKYKMLNFKSTSKGYHESGINLKGLLKIKMINFIYLGGGIGAFINWGHYAKEDVKDNLKMMININATF